MSGAGGSNGWLLETRGLTKRFGGLVAVDDLPLAIRSGEIRGLIGLLESDHVGPVNIGNPNEFTILELAEAVIDVTGSASEIAFEPLPTDDPTQRKPDITLAQELLGWTPEVELREGLERTHAWYRAEFGADASGVPRG